MKYVSIILFICLFLLTGCRTTRKAVESNTIEKNTEQNTVTNKTESQTQEKFNSTSKVNEILATEIDFTRYEFIDGTAIDELTPIIQTGTDKQGVNIRTMPPDIIKGIKSVTTGHVNLNRQTEQETTTQAAKDSEQNISQKSNNNIKTESSQQSKSNEKERHGFIYYIGLLVISIITILLIILIARYIHQKKINSI